MVAEDSLRTEGGSNTTGQKARIDVWRRILSVPVEILVGLFVVLDGTVAPLFRPLMRLISSLELVQRVERAIGRMPPYLILVLLAVPFGIAELTKVYAVVLMAEEHFRLGMTLFIGAYVVSILVCERTFQAGKGQLLKIGWFKIGYDFVMAIKDRVLAWCRETMVWRKAAELRQKARIALRRTRVRLQLMAAPRPRRSLERS